MVLLMELALLNYRGFFFQAEDGIRDRTVTGVQTCALPISPEREELEVGDRPVEPAPRQVQVDLESRSPAAVQVSLEAGPHERRPVAQVERQLERRHGPEREAGGQEGVTPVVDGAQPQQRQ